MATPLKSEPQVKVSKKAIASELEVPAKESPLTKVGRADAKRVLLVEDDDLVRKTTKMVLEVSGFQVPAVESGFAALELLEDQGIDMFDAVVLDLSMPSMSGRETLVRIREIAPLIPVVIYSGYRDELASLKRDYPQQLASVAKPFKLPELSEALRDLMAHREDGSLDSIDGD